MAISKFEAPHIVPPTTQHTHTIIALHGRGSQGPEFAQELFEQTTSSHQTLQQALPFAKWVFPSSQERYSTVFQEQLDEWFDIYSLTRPDTREELQVEGLHDSIAFLRNLLSDESQLVGYEKIILLGLSQGCATALLLLLATEMKLGAFVGLNGWIPFRAQITESIPKGGLADFFKSALKLDVRRSDSDVSVHETPVFLGHTIDDEVIDIELGRQARSVLQTMGMNVVWREVQEGRHLGMLRTSGLDAIVAFLRRELAFTDI